MGTFCLPSYILLHLQSTDAQRTEIWAYINKTINLGKVSVTLVDTLGISKEPFGSK